MKTIIVGVCHASGHLFLEASTSKIISSFCQSIPRKWSFIYFWNVEIFSCLLLEYGTRKATVFYGASTTEIFLSSCLSEYATESGH